MCLEGIFLFHGFLHSRQRRLAEQTLHFTMCKLTKPHLKKELYHKQHVILYNGDLSRELSSNIPPAFPKGTTCWQKFFFPAELVGIVQLAWYCSSALLTSVVIVDEAPFTYISPGEQVPFFRKSCCRSRRLNLFFLGFSQE